jgi:hypothetical protein
MEWSPWFARLAADQLQPYRLGALASEPLALGDRRRAITRRPAGARNTTMVIPGAGRARPAR